MDVPARWVAPTIVSGVSPDSALMQEEIFGAHARMDGRILGFCVCVCVSRQRPHAGGDRWYDDEECEYVCVYIHIYHRPDPPCDL